MPKSILPPGRPDEDGVSHGSGEGTRTAKVEWLEIIRSPRGFEVGNNS
jgi:hypothetical protein